ncbi:MAG: ribosome maturation factor RimM [Erysipelotrichaceae bacterium]|jgi:16S rRNA processing protein RimM|nr:ribosome maturation factor RimM [Erysipelotrichaceae bacterium]
MAYIRIGRIVNTHGIKGEVRIQSESDFDEIRYQKGNTVYLHTADGYLPFEVASFRFHKNFVLVSFRDHADINLVEQYKGCGVYIDEKDRQKLPEGEYYRDQLEGLKAFDEEGSELGEVIAVEETLGAQNNLRIRLTDGREVLVPNIPAFIRNVDLENGTVTVHRMEGLL